MLSTPLREPSSGRCKGAAQLQLLSLLIRQAARLPRCGKVHLLKEEEVPPDLMQVLQDNASTPMSLR